MNFLNKIFPTYCVGCHKPGSYLCNDCKQNLVLHTEICPVCHSYSKHFLVCPKCKKYENIYYEGIIIGFKYNGILKKLILNLKFLHLYDQSKFLSQILQNHILSNPFLQTSLNQKNLVVSYVPSHWFRKYFVKGYNQSQLLAQNLSNILQVPLLSLCTKTKYTKSQTKLNRKQRLKNLLGAFKVYENGLKGNENIIIIDDITTTGTTLNELAKTIKNKFPDVKVWGVVLGRSA